MHKDVTVEIHVDSEEQGGDPFYTVQIDLVSDLIIKECEN